MVYTNALHDSLVHEVCKEILFVQKLYFQSWLEMSESLLVVLAASS